MESTQAPLKSKYASMPTPEILDKLKHLAAQWFSNDEILLLEELFRRYIPHAKSEQTPVE